MNPLTLSLIAQFAGASLSSGDGTVVINKVSTDSRTLNRVNCSLHYAAKILKATILSKPVQKPALQARSLISTGRAMFRTISHFSVRPIRSKPTRRWQPITGGRSR